MAAVRPDGEVLAGLEEMQRRLREQGMDDLAGRVEQAAGVARREPDRAAVLLRGIAAEVAARDPRRV